MASHLIKKCSVKNKKKIYRNYKKLAILHIYLNYVYSKQPVVYDTIIHLITYYY